MMFSVDRRGFYRLGEDLQLFEADPYNWRPLCHVEEFSYTPESVRCHVGQLFPEGLSLHGWEWVATRHEIVQANENGQHYVNYSLAIELVFEFVRRAAFPSIPSRLQSYFAFDNLDAVRAFAGPGQPIYRLEADQAFRADQQWLRLGVQGAMASFHAHQYWSQAATRNPSWEVLLVPPVRVVCQVE